MPALFLRDLELIKQVTTRDFDHFTDHMPMCNAKADPLFGRILILLKGCSFLKLGFYYN